ncbi:hypothetical protein STSP2_00761 [Anaerohalosphaera lusitana]|uniref:Lipoprotein n=1 Tax=Anaerohalosphaera lusitana TaxID=1936003 RepID=A0A1U9NI59_9BACT|nr:hypothetical protein [Anaerohalosphaera lusitana]AQT67613.1 hypothetical protein STSP2_00761 [Anaerohalosphaera lusitana]
MFRKCFSLIFVVSIIAVIFTSGCGQKTANLQLQFQPDETDTFKVTTRTIQSYEFSEPALEKVKQEKTGSTVEMVYDRKITGVAEDGTAQIENTIKELKVFLQDKDGIKYDFDSQRDDDSNDPLAKIVGMSYKISKTPAGKVTVIDAADIRNAVKAGFAGTINKGLFEDKAIIERHEILALPDPEQGEVEVGESWTRIKGSHPRLLDPKSFEKTYTLTSIDKEDGSTVATIDMSAIESAVRAEDHPQSKGFGFMIKMFDTQEEFTGTLKLNLDTGDILLYDETLDAKYIATEESFGAQGPQQQQPEPQQQPDTLTMGFLNSIRLEKLN